MKKVNHYNTILPVGILLGLTAIAGLLLTSKSSSAESTSANAAVIVPEACTMTSHNDTPHTATLSPSTYSGASGSEYENGIGKTTLTAICNDSNGFAIYAIGYTGNSYDSENHTKLVGSSTERTIDTAVYTNNDTPSNWSMKVTKVTNSSESYNPQNMSILNNFDSWHVVPANYTKVAQYHANTGSSVTDSTLGAKIETTYAAFIAPNQPSDTYIGQVKYTMVHPYTEEPLQPQTTASGKICYYANASNAEGTMGCQDVANSVDLLASNFSRTGYGFAGWSDKFDYATNNETHFYGPQETITIPDTSIYTGEGKGLSLYAVWVKSEGSIQDAAKVSVTCNRLTTAPTDGTANLKSVSAFTDSRDNNTYAIAKLADGKCWMIENLRLDNSAALTIANTNKPLNDGTNVTLKHNYADTETYNTLSPTSDVAYYASTTPDGWCITSSAACDDQSRLSTDNTANRITYTENQNVTSQDANIYSYGNYYNWYSATAGNGTYNFSTGNNSVAGDLCPVGWHLPKGGNKSNEANNEFWSLVVTGINGGTNPANYESSNTPSYTGTPEGTDASNKLRAYPNNFVYSGHVYNGPVSNRGSYGYFWSSTAYSSKNAYELYLHSSNIYPGTSNYYKYSGRSVRCVAPGV